MTNTTTTKKPYILHAATKENRSFVKLIGRFSSVDEMQKAAEGLVNVRMWFPHLNDEEKHSPLAGGYPSTEHDLSADDRW
jgi:hypothetical protein